MYSKDVNRSLINSNSCRMTHTKCVCTHVHMAAASMVERSGEQVGQRRIRKSNSWCLSKAVGNIQGNTCRM